VGPLDAVLQAARQDGAVSDAAALELALDLREQLDRPPAGGMRIDEQQVATAGTDRVNLVAS
jgi:hypothetical protein